MTFKDLEYICTRAAHYCVSKKKFLLVFPILVVCGLLIVLCKALAINASRWVMLSLTFLPIFLCSGILLGTGVLLARIYYKEVKAAPLAYRKILKQSWQLVIGVSYISFPLILCYLMLWATMGVFYLFKEIPGIGDFISVVLAFAPFLLVLSTLILALISFFMLFYLTPHIALKDHLSFKLIDEMKSQLQQNIFANVFLFILALLPLIAVVGLLTLAALVTGVHFSSSVTSISIAMQWFFIMLPFSAILTPVVIYFFNFSTESYALIRKQYVT